MTDKPITIAAVGAGFRTRGYCTFALEHPDKMKVVAVAEPDPARRHAMAQEHAVPPEMCFASADELAAQPRLADAVINGTMDRQHYATAMPLIRMGYHMLLEKPIAPTEAEVRELIAAATENQRTVMICHVLRYAPFYRTIKELVAGGHIGNLVAIHMEEAVSYLHMAVAFIRGRWNNSHTSNPILLAKCCHDLDIIAWLMSGVPAARVASFGSLQQFKPANAPPGSTARCLDGCAIEPTCPYSARTHYIVQDYGWGYPWEQFDHPETLTVEEKLQSLATDNPYGRCVWRCDNDVVDHQSVLIEFANGVTASHDLFCATARPERTLHLLGEVGEIEGTLGTGSIKIRRFCPEPGPGFTEELIDLNAVDGSITGGHGGGDIRLIEDFIAVLRGDAASQAVTRIEDSLTSHLIAFAADTAMQERRVAEIA